MIRQPNAEFVAIYAHQNAEDLGSSIRDAHMLSEGLGIDVLAFEYSGYGLSEKPERAYPSSRLLDGHAIAPSFKDADRERAEPSEKACCSDIMAAYTYLADQCNVHPSKIIVFGRSIGSGPAVYCATNRRVGGLVLISPIASAVRVPLKRLNVTLPFIDTFPNIDRASKIMCPVLVVHGDMDELVPKLQAERLFQKIRQKGNAVRPLFIPTAKHNNVVEDFHSIVFGRYLMFLDELKAMKADRKSMDDRPRVKQRGRRQLDENQRPQLQIPHKRRQRHPFAFLRAPRASLDKFSVRANAGDRDAKMSKSGSLNKYFSPLGCFETVESLRDSCDLEGYPPLQFSPPPTLPMYQTCNRCDVITEPLRGRGRPLKSIDDQKEIQTMSWDLFRMSLETFQRNEPS